MKRSTVFVAAFAFALAACDKPAEPAAPTPPPVAVPEPTPPPPPAAAPPKSPLGDMVIPADNAQSGAKIELGHQLFFDKRLSVDGTRSCYSCHQNEDGNGGHDAIAIGPGEKKLTRHSPVIWNVGYLTAHYWDGRAPTLEAQAIGALGGGNMGLGKDNLEKKAAELAAIPGYKTQFDAVFPGEGATAANIAKALSAYERSLVCDATAYDRFVAGDKAALNDAQTRGRELFTGEAGCIACHTPPFFSSSYTAPTGVYFNAGIGTNKKPEADVDVGRMSVTKAEADWAAFKVPSLRNVSKSAPYFHDGHVATLTEAVKLMASGGIKNKNLTPLMMDKKLTDAQVADIVAFLGSLDCNTSLAEPKLP
jgi:cytochrome c peroxidase